MWKKSYLHQKLTLWAAAEFTIQLTDSYEWGGGPEGNSTQQIETRTANRWGTTNSKPPGRIIMIDQSKTGGSSHIIFITLFSSKCTALLCFLPASANWAKYAGEEPFSWAIRFDCMCKEGDMERAGGMQSASSRVHTTLNWHAKGEINWKYHKWMNM